MGSLDAGGYITNLALLATLKFTDANRFPEDIGSDLHDMAPGVMTLTPGSVDVGLTLFMA